MKRKRFTEKQIIGILREQEARAKTGEIARKHGVSDATLYNWKAKFGGMDVSDAKRPKALEDENGKLKRLLADAMLDNTALKEMLSRNGETRRSVTRLGVALQHAIEPRRGKIARHRGLRPKKIESRAAFNGESRGGKHDD